MTIVLTDQEMDRAEAFRLAKRYRLPPEVVLSDDPEIHRFLTFLELNGISDTPIMRRISSSRIRSGMTSAMSSSGATYADRLSHVLDVDDPVSFVDLRQSLPVDPGDHPPSSIPCNPPSASADAGPGGAEAERPAETGPGGPTDTPRWGQPGAPGASVGLPGRQPGANPFQTLSGDP